MNPIGYETAAREAAQETYRGRAHQGAFLKGALTDKPCPYNLGSPSLALRGFANAWFWGRQWREDNIPQEDKA